MASKPTIDPDREALASEGITVFGALAVKRRDIGWTQERQTEWFSDLIRDLPESGLLDAAIHVTDSVTGWCSPRSRLYPVTDHCHDCDDPATRKAPLWTRVTGAKWTKCCEEHAQTRIETWLHNGWSMPNEEQR